ncbi:hypothetical protein Tsubulata_019739 [Turnera subulata]|uniref:F-box domain-containing protein n=1 Tax=Turnera subulata TaxID=218843 RepID=A0A9Q0FU24_9ROSI|nr:hypothetical protein Tsubulata_019739 [Turnera subulata]
MNSIMERSSSGTGEEEEDMSDDRLSRLPEDIKRIILSLLTETDRVCLSVVSKTWHKSWTSFPIFQFSESSMGLLDAQNRGMEEEDIKYMRKEFINFVEYSLRKKTGLSVLQLSVSHYRDTTIGYKTFGWIKNAFQKRSIRELNLEIVRRDGWPNREFVMARNFFSAENLTTLKLSRCSFARLPPNGNVSWPSLKVLHLSEVSLAGGQFFNGLIKGCPLIEEIALTLCSFDQEVLPVSGFTRLVQVVLDQPVGVERIEVDNVPNLLMFTLQENSLHGCKYVVIGANTSLEVLKLSSWSVSPEVCTDISSKFPALKVLHLKLCSLDRIRISSPQLEELALWSSTKVVGIVDAPKLKSLKQRVHHATAVASGPPHVMFFSYYTRKPNVIMKGRQSLHNLQLEDFQVYELGVSDLFKMREYLANFKQIEHLRMSIHDKIVCEGEPWKKSLELASCDLVPIPAMPRIKCLELEYTRATVKDDAKYEGALDGLLWICHPESVLVSFLSGNVPCFANLLIAAFCKELSMFFRKCKDCCTSARIKCWRHDLKSFQVKRVGVDGHSSETRCRNLLQSLPQMSPQDKICFMLQW